jgi:hypothetical protein
LNIWRECLPKEAVQHVLSPLAVGVDWKTGMEWNTRMNSDLTIQPSPAHFAIPLPGGGEEVRRRRREGRRRRRRRRRRRKEGRRRRRRRRRRRKEGRRRRGRGGEEEEGRNEGEGRRISLYFSPGSQLLSRPV